MIDQKDILEKLNDLNKGTLMENIGLSYTEFTGDSLTAVMPVTPKVHQPYGLLHGGMNAVIAETVGSVLSILQYKEEEKKGAVGLNINVNHIKSVRDGNIYAKATFLKKGRTIHFISIDIKNDKGELTAHSTMSTKVINLF